MRHNKNNSKLSFVILIAAFLVIYTVTIFGQGGAATSQNRNTENKSDSNLKSLAHVNPSTLAMEMSVPFMNYPGRNGNSLPVGLSYSSKLWRMKSKGTYFYVTPIGNHKQYVTQLYPAFAERTAGGWTSSVSFPVIEEELVTYNQLGDPFDDAPDIDRFHQLFLSSLSSTTSSNLISNPNLPCGTSVCTQWTQWCPNPGDCTPWICTRTDINIANCGGGWSGGSGCYYQNGYCPASCSYCIEPPHCPDWNPNCSNNPDIPNIPEMQQQMHYVKRVYVRMSDGSTQEFRKSDAVFGYCNGRQNDGPNCEDNDPDNIGVFLSVDGSGMKLVRDSNGSTLYLSNGGRYIFPNQASGAFDKKLLYQSTDYYDADGNHSKFQPTTDENLLTSNNQRIRKMTDTLGREIYDPLPQNLIEQTQIEGDQAVSLPGLNGNITQNYQLKWRHLKPVPCTQEVTTNCGNSEGALENENQDVYFYANHICFGNAERLVDPNNNYPNQKLFPYNGIGLRSCNPDTGGTLQTTIAKKFNPVVLSGIVLPNGQSYTFKYNQFGEITKIVYPTGSYETFKYDQIAPMNGYNEMAYDQTNRGVTERKVYLKKADDSYELEQKWSYSAQLTNALSANSTYKVTTISPKGNDPMGVGIKSERILHSDTKDEHTFGFTDPRAGMPKEERTYDENGTLRSRTLNEWIVKGPLPSNDPLRPAFGDAKRDPRIKSTVSVMVDSGQALATLSETEYDEPGTNGYTVEGQTDPAYFSHLNVKRKKAYHFAVVPLSVAQTGTLSQIASYFNSNLLSNTAETDYQYDTNYKARGISSLPTESRVYDNNGNVITRSRTEYDQSNYLNGESGTLSSSLANTWIDPATDESIPINSRSKRGKPTTSKVWDDDNNRWISTHTTYDQYGNPRKVWEAVADPATPSRFVETQYDDPNNNSCGGNPCPQSYAYPTKVITPGPSDGTHGTNLGSQAWTTYDFTTGLPLTATNEFGQTTATEYVDPLLRPTRSYAVNFAAPESQTIYDDNALTVKVRKQIDEQNWDEATTFSDSLGRTFKTQAKDSQGDVFVETKYDLLGRPVAVTNPYRQNDTVYWSKTRYDEMGRAVEAYAPANFNTLGDSLGITEYGISSQTRFIGTVVTKTDASGRKSRSFTNALGQLTRVDEPGSNNQLDTVPQTTPTPNPSPTPPPNYPTDPPSCAANCPNNLTGSEYPMHSTYYEYNVQGKMVKVTQGVQVRYFMYDSLGRLIRVKQPEQEVNDALDKSDPSTGNGKWTAKFTYDLFGNVITTTDANGITSISEYDKANRVFKRCYTKPGIVTSVTKCDDLSTGVNGQLSSDTPTVENFYDGFGLGVTPPEENNYAKGKLSKVTSSISETRYKTYDYLGRLIESEQRTPIADEGVTQAIPRISTYKYDFGGRLIEETYPSGRIIKNSFESDGDLANVVSKAATQVGFKTYVSNFSYTAAGGISQMQFGNGRWETAKFNTRQQVEELGLGNANNDTSLWKINYTYGELESNGTINQAKNTGNIAKQTITIGGLAQPFVQTYKYDSLYRITDAKEVNGTGTTANWSQQFSYDRYGNRIGFNQQIGSLTTSNLPTVNTANNRFAENQGFKYDKAGNIIEDRDMQQVRSFVFNAYNKQIEINRNGAPVGKYFYDGEGKRVKKQTELETTVFVYSAGKLVAEYSTKMPYSPTTNYTTTDQLGSPRVVTDKLGQIRSRRDFMPFGEELAADANYRTAGLKYGVADEVRQKFTGYQKDTETGLDFAEARMYNNQHGRFTAVDPLLASGKSANPQTFNRFVYVLNNPLRLIDPSGLKPVYLRKYIDEGNGSYHWDWSYVDDKKEKTQYDKYIEQGYIIYTPAAGETFTSNNDRIIGFNNGFVDLGPAATATAKAYFWKPKTYPFTQIPMRNGLGHAAVQFNFNNKEIYISYYPKYFGGGFLEKLFVEPQDPTGSLKPKGDDFTPPPDTTINIDRIDWKSVVDFQTNLQLNPGKWSISNTCGDVAAKVLQASGLDIKNDQYSNTTGPGLQRIVQDAVNKPRVFNQGVTWCSNYDYYHGRQIYDRQPHPGEIKQYFPFSQRW